MMANPQYAASPDGSEANPNQQGEDFDNNLRQLSEILQRNKAAHQAMAGRQAMAQATQPYVPPSQPSPEMIRAQQILQQGGQALQQKNQQIDAAMKAATLNLDPLQKAALALKLHQNVLAAASGHDISNHIEMPLDPRSALLSASYGAGGSSLGDPFGGAARILASLGPTAQMPRSTLDLYHEMQANRPHKVVVQIHHGAPEEKSSGDNKKASK
jgi:hypothetical protein